MKIIVLDSTAKSIKAVLASSVATSNPDFVVAYADTSDNTFSELSSDGQLNDTTDVTLVGAPASGVKRAIKSITIYNRDTAAVTVSIKFDNGGTQRILQRVQLVSGETWHSDDLSKLGPGGSDTQVQFNDSGTLAGSSNFTYNKTTSVLTLGANPILTAGTANGVLYLNGSKAATTGSALTFDGTNLGVGTASPASYSGYTTLDIDSATNGGLLNIKKAGTTVGYLNGVSGITLLASGSNNLQLTTGGAGNIIFNQNATEGMRLTSTGLTVEQGAVFNESGADSDFRVESDTNAYAIFLDAGNSRVGINTSNLYQSFTVNGAIEAGTATSVAGGVSMYAPYGGGSSDYLAVWGSKNSNGGPAMNYGGYWDNSSQFISAYDNFSGNHSSLYNASGDLVFVSDFSASQTTSGTAVSGMVTRWQLGINGFIFNENGDDIDFRVESDNLTHMLFVDAGNDVVAIGTSSVENWYQRALQGPSWGITELLGIDQTGWSTGCYQDAYGYNTNWKFKGNYAASLYTQTGDHTFFLTTSTRGAGNPITWRNVLALSDSAAVFNEEGYDIDFRVESDTNTHALFVDAGSSTVGVNSSFPASGVAGYDALIGFGAYGKIVSASNASVAASGYIDITLSSGGGSFAGFLTVNNVNAVNAAERTQVTYSIFGRGTNSFSAQLIATDNGSSGGMAITISNPSEGVIRITNSAAVATHMTAAFFGSTGY